MEEYLNHVYITGRRLKKFKSAKKEKINKVLLVCHNMEEYLDNKNE